MSNATPLTLLRVSMNVWARSGIMAWAVAISGRESLRACCDRFVRRVGEDVKGRRERGEVVRGAGEAEGATAFKEEGRSTVYRESKKRRKE